MTTPPVSSNFSIGSSVSAVWQEAGQAFGHAWKTIHQLPHQFYQIILTIREILMRCLGISSKHDFSSTTTSASPTPIRVTPSKTPVEETQETPLEPEGEVSSDLEVNDADSPVSEIEDQASDLAEEAPFSLVLGTKDQTALILEDPLGSMGTTVAPDSRSDFQICELDQEILREAKQFLQPAQDLMQKIADGHPTTLQADLDLREQLEGTWVSLMSDASTFIEIEEAHELIQKTLAALQKEKQSLDEKLCNEARNLVHVAQDLLKTTRTKKQRTLEANLDLREHLEDALVALNKYASTFEAVPEAHRLVQNTIQELEKKVQVLDKELCALVKRHYRPNYGIPKDGHCLFWSIKHHLKSKEGIKYFRKLAADYIRNHPQEFEEGVLDTLKSQVIQDKINDYIKVQGGKRKWMTCLELKLGRKPNTIDRYCDCLENSKLWGGVNELLALSGLESGDDGAIQVPILVFTCQKDRNWRIDLVIRGKFKDKPPLLLYYNGLNHYQNLIRR